MNVKELFKKYFNILKDQSVSIFCLYMILFCSETLLYGVLHSSIIGMSVFNYLFLIPIAFVLSGFINLFRFSIINKFITFLIIQLISIFYIGEFLYYKSSGSLLSVSILGVGGDAITNFWWSLEPIILENRWIILLFELPVIIYFIYLIRSKRKAVQTKGHLTLIVTGVLLWFVLIASLPLGGQQEYSAYNAYHSRYVDTDTASRKLGVMPNFVVEVKYSFIGGRNSTPVLENSETVNMEEEESQAEALYLEEDLIRYHEYEGLDFNQLAKLSEDQEILALCDYLGSLECESENDYTGLFEGYNLIYICAESFSSMAIDENITPTLYKMANNGIVLNNYYNSFKNVTTNGEYALLTGLWPDVARKQTNGGNLTGTMGQSINKDMSQALGNMFNESEGLQCRGYHNYLGDYYGRNKTLPNMGFECKFMNDGMKFSTRWPTSDYEMIEQSVEDYINEDRFVTYYMTFSGHGSYTEDNIMVARNIKTVSKMLNTFLPTSATGYLSCNYELEKGMTYLLEKLEEAGKLDNTVIVLTGDHYPYYLTDAGYQALRGEKFDEDFGSFKSTCIIYNAGLQEKIETDVPCTNVDILPTILNLFNIDYDSRLYAGSDIFAKGDHIAQLYNRNFISDYVRYNNATGKAEWLVDTEKYTEEQLSAYLDSAINIVKNRYAMSVEIEDTDFYGFLFEHYNRNSGRIR